ncbi:MAG: TlpA disulfide reductase family protein [Polyangiaceae bacterium]
MLPEFSARTSHALAMAGQLAFIAMAALFVYGFVATAKDSERRRTCSAACLLRPDYMGAERRAPDFSLSDVHGRAVRLTSLRGKVVVLNFWSKTCGPCLEEMPDLAELTRLLRDRSDVAVVAVSTDEGAHDVLQTLHTALNEEPPFTVLLDPDSSIVGGKYGTHMFPETWFIDKRGVIRARFDGVREWNTALVLDFIDDLRRGDICEAKVDESGISGLASAVCEELGGS